MAQAIVPPTASQRAHAETLLADPGRWLHGRSKETGEQFWVIQGSKGAAHWATNYGCTCKGFAYRGVCSHVLAVTMREAQAAARQPVITCAFPECAEPVETPRTLCAWHSERKARLARELGVA